MLLCWAWCDARAATTRTAHRAPHRATPHRRAVHHHMLLCFPFSFTSFVVVLRSAFFSSGFSFFPSTLPSQKKLTLLNLRQHHSLQRPPSPRASFPIHPRPAPLYTLPAADGVTTLPVRKTRESMQKMQSEKRTRLSTSCVSLLVSTRCRSACRQQVPSNIFSAPRHCILVRLPNVFVAVGTGSNRTPCVCVCACVVCRWVLMSKIC